MIDDNSTITLCNDKTISLTEHLKQTSISLIESLEEYKDAYSIELRKVLKNSLGLSYSKLIKNINKIENESKTSFYKLYNININILLSEIFYPCINGDVINFNNNSVTKKSFKVQNDNMNNSKMFDIPKGALLFTEKIELSGLDTNSKKGYVLEIDKDYFIYRDIVKVESKNIITSTRKNSDTESFSINWLKNIYKVVLIEF